MVKYFKVPLDIVSDHDVWFISRLWTTLFNMIRTRLKFSIVNHPQTDRQTKDKCFTWGIFKTLHNGNVMKLVEIVGWCAVLLQSLKVLSDRSKPIWVSFGDTTLKSYRDYYAKI